MASYTGQPSIRGPEALQTMLLTFTNIGITFTWSIEQTYCTPYLLKLGLTKSNTSLVWIAGPLTGLIAQPIVGAIADESTSRWGRRRPLMVVGAAITALSLLVLGFTREIIGVVIHDDDGATVPTIVLAVLAIYAADFAINAIMACSRSLIADTLSIDKQQSGAAWLSRMSAIGHIVAYATGAIDLLSIFGHAFGDTQFKQVAVIAAFAVISTTLLTCWAVTERVLVSAPESKHKGRFKVLRRIWSTLLHLPPRIQAICWAQFWSWIGWFPFLFYSTTWIGETYFRYDVPKGAKGSDDVLGDIGRVGSTSLVIYSCITFAGAFVLPLLVRAPDDKESSGRVPAALAGFMERFGKFKPDLLTTWFCGHLMFSASMALAPLARSYLFATILVCFCGLPWTIAMWAPTAFLGVEVNRLSGNSMDAADAPYRRLSTDSDVELSAMEQNNDDDAAAAEPALPNGDAGDEGSGGHGSAISSTGELSGIYFGILNIYTTLPQFLGSFISTIVFAIFEPGKSPELSDDGPPADTSGPNAIAISLFIGAMSTLIAAYATRRLRYL